jgi:hypothetical protein
LSINPMPLVLAWGFSPGNVVGCMVTAEPAHVQQARHAQDELLRAMTPKRRLEVAQELYDTAWHLKAAGLRREHPDWPEERVLGKLRRIFVTGYAGA